MGMRIANTDNLLDLKYLFRTSFQGIGFQSCEE